MQGDASGAIPALSGCAGTWLLPAWPENETDVEKVLKGGVGQCTSVLVYVVCCCFAANCEGVFLLQSWVKRFGLSRLAVLPEQFSLRWCSSPHLRRS